MRRAVVRKPARRPARRSEPSVQAQVIQAMKAYGRAATRAAGSGGPPPDPTFYLPLRLILQSDPLRQPYRQHWAVYAATQAIIQPLSTIPFRIFTMKAGGKKQTTKDIEDSLSRVLHRRMRRGTKEWNADQDGLLEHIAALPTPRQRMRELKKHAPWLSPTRLCRAVAADASPVESGPWYDLFRIPNPESVRATLWEATFIYLGIEGECFWILLGATGPAKPNEIPCEIWPMGPKGWSYKADPRTKIPQQWFLKTKGETGEGDGNSQTFDPKQLVRWKYFDPYNPMGKGLATIQPLMGEIEVDYRAATFNKATLENGAFLGGFISTDRKMTPEQKRQFTEEFSEKHGGSNKAKRIGFFDGGAKYTPAAMTHAEMEFQKLREYAMNCILAGFRTPRSQVGLTENVNRNSMQVSNRNLWETNLIPKTIFAEDLLDARLFTQERAGDDTWGAFDLSIVDALREDLTDKMQTAALMVTAGWTINQVNERLGLGMPMVPWGDTWYPPIAVQAAGIGQTDKAHEPFEDPDEGDDIDASTGSKTDTDDGTGKTKPPEEEPAPEDKKKSLIGTLAFQVPKRMTASERQEHSVRLIATVFQPAENAYERKLKSFLFDMRKAQLKRITDAHEEGHATLPDQLVVPAAEWKDVLAKKTKPLYLKTFNLAVTNAQAELTRLKRDWREAIDDADVEVFVDGLSTKVGRIVDTVRDQLLTVLAQAVADGDSLEDTQAAVRNLFNDIATGGRMGTVARTETGYAVGGGRDATFTAANIESSEWLTAGDERVRDNHVIYGDSGAHPRGFNYAELAGEGYTLTYPMDPACDEAGEVVNCRCAELPL
jgi:hypothetical protein